MSDSHKVIIIGHHPIKDNLKIQFESLGYIVTLSDVLSESIKNEEWDDIAIISSADKMTQ